MYSLDIKKCLGGVIAVLAWSQIYGQPPAETTGYTRQFVSDFDSREALVWKTQSTARYSLTLQEGVYAINSTDNTIADIILPETDSISVQWAINARMKVGSKTGSAGLVFNVQERLREYYFVEFNAKKQYRVGSKSADNAVRWFTGTQKGQGWNNAKHLPRASNFFTVQIRQQADQLLVYADGQKLYQFSPGSNIGGYFGIMVSGAVQAQYDSLAAWQKPPATAQRDTIPKDIAALTRALLDARLKLKQQEALLESNARQIADQKQQLHGCHSFVANGLDARLQKQNEQLKTENQNLKAENETLRNTNAEMMRFRKQVEAMKDGDLIIILTETLEKERAEKEALKKRVAELERQLNQRRR